MRAAIHLRGHLVPSAGCADDDVPYLHCLESEDNGGMALCSTVFPWCLVSRGEFISMRFRSLRCTTHLEFVSQVRIASAPRAKDWFRIEFIPQHWQKNISYCLYELNCEQLSTTARSCNIDNC